MLLRFLPRASCLRWGGRLLRGQGGEGGSGGGTIAGGVSIGEGVRGATSCTEVAGGKGMDGAKVKEKTEEEAEAESEMQELLRVRYPGSGPVSGRGAVRARSGGVWACSDGADGDSAAGVGAQLRAGGRAGDGAGVRDSLE